MLSKKIKNIYHYFDMRVGFNASIYPIKIQKVQSDSVYSLYLVKRRNYSKLSGFPLPIEIVSIILEKLHVALLFHAGYSEI